MNKLKNFLTTIQKTKKNAPISNNLSVLEDRKNMLDLNIFIMVDMSGSISNQQFNQFISSVREIKGLSRVIIAEYDTEVRALYNLEALEKYKPIYRQPGSGGNYELSVFSYIKKLNPDAVLHMTDGGVMGPTPKKPDCPIGYILSSNGHKPYDFGEVLLKLPSTNLSKNIKKYR